MWSSRSSPSFPGITMSDRTAIRLARYRQRVRSRAQAAALDKSQPRRHLSVHQEMGRVGCSKVGCSSGGCHAFCAACAGAEPAGCAASAGSGAIEKVDGANLTVKARDGMDAKVAVTDATRI